MSFLLANKNLITRDPAEMFLPELSCLHKFKNYKKELYNLYIIQKQILKSFNFLFFVKKRRKIENVLMFLVFCKTNCYFEYRIRILCI